MIKLFDEDDGQKQTGKGKTPASSSLSIVPEADPQPLETQAVEEEVSYAGVEETSPEPSPEPPPPDDPALRPVENIVEKIQEEPAALRWDESPGTGQEIPPQHTYGPEDPGPPPEAGRREYPPGFPENGPKPDVFVSEPYEPQSKADARRGPRMERRDNIFRLDRLYAYPRVGRRSAAGQHAVGNSRWDRSGIAYRVYPVFPYFIPNF